VREPEKGGGEVEAIKEFFLREERETSADWIKKTRIVGEGDVGDKNKISKGASRNKRNRFG